VGRVYEHNILPTIIYVGEDTLINRYIYKRIWADGKRRGMKIPEEGKKVMVK
jgi:hypothetical protein